MKVWVNSNSLLPSPSEAHFTPINRNSKNMRLGAFFVKGGGQFLMREKDNLFPERLTFTKSAPFVSFD
jgi:hypothetical protein